MCILWSKTTLQSTRSRKDTQWLNSKQNANFDDKGLWDEASKLRNNILFMNAVDVDIFSYARVGGDPHETGIIKDDGG